MTGNESPLAASERLLERITRGSAARKARAAEGSSPSKKPRDTASLAERAAFLKGIWKSLVRFGSFASGAGEADRVGVSFGRFGIVLVRASKKGIVRLEEMRFFEYEPGAERTDQEKLLEQLGRVLKDYLADKRFRKERPLVEMFLPTAVNEHNIFFELAASVKGEEMDSVALLSALQVKNFETTAYDFDYRVQRERSVNDPDKRLCFGWAVEKEGLEAFRAQLEAADVPVHGLHSRIFSQLSIFRAGWLPPQPCRNYAAVTIAQHVTVVTIFVDKVPILQRLLHLGLNEIQQELLNRSDADAIDLSFVPGAQKSITPEVTDLLSSPNLSEGKRSWLESVLDPTLERVTNFVTRVLALHRIERVFLTDADNLAPILAQRIELKTGLATRVIGWLGPMSEQATTMLAELRNKGCLGTCVEATALALMNLSMPNILQPPAVRRRQAWQRRCVSIVCSLLFVLSVGLALTGAVAVGESWLIQQRIDALEDELATFRVKHTPSEVNAQLRRIEQLRNKAVEVTHRRRFVAVLAELSQIRGVDMYFTNLTLTPTSDTENGKPVARNKAGHRPKVLMIEGYVKGSLAHRQTVLTDFMRQLWQRPELGTNPKLSGLQEQKDMTRFAVRLTGVP